MKLRMWKAKKSFKLRSDSKCLVISRHLQTFFIGKADAQTLYEKINNAISNAKLQFSKILMIGSDGPNVNKTVHKLFNDELIATRSHGLVNIGTCHIHIVHNAYLNALQAFGQDASDLTVSVYNYFDGWPSRVEEYAKIQEVHKLPQKKFLKHSPSRWLSFHCAAERLIEQWVGLEQYFLKFIPSNKNKSVINSSSYQKIRALLQCSTMKAQLHLAMSSAENFPTFTESFQKDEPLIHVLYLQLRDLVAKLAGRICKVVSENQFANHDLFKSENMLPINDVILSDNIKNCLSEIPEKVVPMFMDNVKQHYMASCRYLIDKTMGTCNNPNLIRALKCLHPSNVKTRRSLKDINFVAKQLPINVKDDILADEWKMLQLDMDSTFDGRIDCYWNKYLQQVNAIGQKKYKELSKVVKCVFSLSHGNADIERRFSVSRWSLTENKTSTSERTQNATLLIKDELRMFENNPHLVPMTAKLISMGRNAYRRYIMHLEEEKKLKEEQEKKEKRGIAYSAGSRRRK